MRSLLAVLALLALPRPVAAQVRAEWSLADGCPDEGVVDERASAVLVGAPPARLSLTVTHGETGYTADLSLRGAVDAERRLADPDCDALVDAALLLAALALGLPPPATTSSEAPSPPVRPPDESRVRGPEDSALLVDALPVDALPHAAPLADALPVDALPVDALPVDEGRPEPPALRLRLGLGAALETILPEPPVGLTLDVGLAYDALRVSVTLRAWPRMTARRDEAEGATLYAVMVGLRAGAMADLLEGEAGRLAVGGHGALAVGVLHGEGYGVVEPQAGGALDAWLSALGSAVYWPDPHVGVGLDAGLTVPLVRPSYLLDGAPLFRPAPVGAVVELRLMASLG